MLSCETGYLVKRDPDTVRAPDLAFVSHASIQRWQQLDTAYFPVAPDLAVEVVSPNDRWVDLERKVHEYLAAEGLAVWVLNPAEQTVHVFQAGGLSRVLSRGDTLTGDPVLPGFSVPLADLFGVTTR